MYPHVMYCTLIHTNQHTVVYGQFRGDFIGVTLRLLQVFKQVVELMIDEVTVRVFSGEPSHSEII